MTVVEWISSCERVGCCLVTTAASWFAGAVGRDNVGRYYTCCGCCAAGSMGLRGSLGRRLWQRMGSRALGDLRKPEQVARAIEQRGDQDHPGARDDRTRLRLRHLEMFGIRRSHFVCLFLTSATAGVLARLD